MRMTLRAHGALPPVRMIFEAGIVTYRRDDGLGPYWGVELVMSEALSTKMMAAAMAAPHEAIALGHALIALGKQAMRQT